MGDHVIVPCPKSIKSNYKLYSVVMERKFISTPLRLLRLLATQSYYFSYVTWSDNTGNIAEIQYDQNLKQCKETYSQTYDTYGQYGRGIATANEITNAAAKKIATDKHDYGIRLLIDCYGHSDCFSMTYDEAIQYLGGNS